MKTKKLTSGDCWQARRNKILLQGGFLAKMLVKIENNPHIQYCKSCGNTRSTGETVRDCIELVMRYCIDSAASFDDPEEQKRAFLSSLGDFQRHFYQVFRSFDGEI